MSQVQKLRERLEAKIKQEAETAAAASPAQEKGKSAAAAAPTGGSAAAAKKKSVAANTVLFSTPEEFAKRQKEAEQLEKQNRLHAKQMASKYNMAYRAFELGMNKKEGASGAGGAKSGGRRTSVVNKPGAGAAGAGKGAEADANDGFEKFDAVLDDAFWMTELAVALAYEDDRAINHAILTEFFQDNDPARLEEIDQMLLDWVGQEDELFASLALFYMDSGEGDGSAERIALAVFEGRAPPPATTDATATTAAGAAPAAGSAPAAGAKPAGAIANTAAPKPAASTASKPPAAPKPAAGAAGAKPATATSTAAPAGAGAAAPKPRRASAVSRVAFNASGGVQAAAIATPSTASEEEKTDAPAENINPYILSGLANGNVWVVNAHSAEENRLLRERMLATGHTEEEVKAVMQDQSGYL